MEIDTDLLIGERWSSLTNDLYVNEETTHIHMQSNSPHTYELSFNGLTYLDKKIKGEKKQKEKKNK